LSRAKRQQLHSRVARALQNRFPLTIETEPEVLAYHFGQAGLTERAIDYLLRAGRRSIEQSANAEAIAQESRHRRFWRCVSVSRNHGLTEHHFHQGCRALAIRGVGKRLQ